MKTLFIFLLSALTCFSKIYPSTDWIGTNILNLNSGVTTSGIPNLIIGSDATTTYSIISADHTNNGGANLIIRGGDNYYGGSPNSGDSLQIRAGSGAGGTDTAGTLTLGGQTNRDGTFGTTTILGSVVSSNLLQQVTNIVSTSGVVTNGAVFNLPTNFASINFPTNFLLANPCATNQIIVKSANGTWTTNSTTTNTDVGRGYLLSFVMDNAAGGAGDVFFLSGGRFTNVDYSFQNAQSFVDLTEGGITHAGAHLVGAGKGVTIIDFANTACAAYLGDFSSIRDVTFTNCQGFADSGTSTAHATNNSYDIFYNFAFYQTTNFQDVFLTSANYQNIWIENCTWVFPYDVFASTIVPDTNSVLVSHNSTYVCNAQGVYPITRTQYGVMARTCYVCGDTVSGAGGTQQNIGVDAGDSGKTNSTLYVWNTSSLVSGTGSKSISSGSFSTSQIFLGAGCTIDSTKEALITGVTQTATNTLAVVSTGVTNNTSDTYLLSITAGTGMSLKDPNGNQYRAPVVNGAYPLKPLFRFSGTGITATADILSK